MAAPELVAECVAAMRARVGVPVSVKCRIGIDDQDGEADLENFIDQVAAAGCAIFIVHARKAWLEGLSPKENRQVPPLDYERVRRLKVARPDLRIIVNGGIENLEDGARHLEHVDGVMLGRAAYQDPYLLSEVDRRFFGDAELPPSREEVVQRLIPYVARHLERGGRLNNVTRHVLGLYHGRPRGRLFRRHLSENAVREGATLDVLREALRIAEGRGLGILQDAAA
jgi:tRNA-dihydrouridine synthase A